MLWASVSRIHKGEALAPYLTHSALLTPLPAWSEQMASSFPGPPVAFLQFLEGTATSLATPLPDPKAATPPWEGTCKGLNCCCTEGQVAFKTPNSQLIRVAEQGSHVVSRLSRLAHIVGTGTSQQQAGPLWMQTA